MSGGSFEYLCIKEASDLFASTRTLEAMADELASLGYAADAAADTYDLLAIIRCQSARVEAAMERLKDVFQAVEWWQSSDWDEGQVKQALAAYRGEEAAE